MDVRRVPPRAGGTTLLTVAAALAGTVRASRLAMGTVVGMTVVVEEGAPDPGPAIDRAYAEIERWEATLSEWRPDSLTTQLGVSGGPVTLPPQGSQLLAWAETLRIGTGGRFDVLWRGGEGRGLRHEADTWYAVGGPIDLGGVLKGFLNDRAGEVLIGAGVTNFLIDAAGDLLAHGDAEGEAGWRVEVVGSEGLRLRARLRDEALSTSGNSQQPGHIHDALTGDALRLPGEVSVIAPTGMVADGLATALFLGADMALATRHGAVAVRRNEQGWARSQGARRRFR